MDLGCGSGITARRLADAGFSVVGLDLSEAFVEMARRRVPEGTFRVESFVDAEIPVCVGVTAIGEVLNYAFDERNGPVTRKRVFARVFAALHPGGLFVLDVAGPDRLTQRPPQRFFEGPDWTILVETAGAGSLLERRITTFRRSGELYRRSSETHFLHLVAPDEIEHELMTCGFDVERADAYAGTSLPPGLHGFTAAKPPRDD